MAKSKQNDFGKSRGMPSQQTGLTDDALNEYEEYGINFSGNSHDFSDKPYVDPYEEYKVIRAREHARQIEQQKELEMARAYYDQSMYKQPAKAKDYAKQMKKNEARKQQLFGVSERQYQQERERQERAIQQHERKFHKRAKRPRRKFGKIVRRIIATLLVVVIAFLSYMAYTLNKIHKDNIDESQLGIVPVDGYTNILLLGVDSRDMSDIEGARTDMIMIVSINDKTREVKLTSVFRDTYMRMGNTEDYDKITHAHAYGGPEMTIASLNAAMDLDIEDYATINFKGVADAIDDMGGIEITVEEYEIEQLNTYTIETANVIGREDYNLVTEPGTQTLDGCQAVSYGRIRKGVGDDFKRTERMRIVLSKVMEKVKDMNPLELIRFIDKVLPQCKTDMGTFKMMKYSLLLKGMKISNSAGFPYSKTTGSLGGVSYVFSENMREDVITFHHEVFGQTDYTPSETVEEISQNASY